MLPRSQEILLATIEEYISGREPVSSQLLFKRYGFGIRPASIRSELNELEANGWLSQPYTSGGRVPTDHAYEFYIEYLKNKPQKELNPPRTIFDLAETVLDGEFDNFIGDFADEIHTMSVGFVFGDNHIARSGLDELFGALDVSGAEIYREVARELETLDERLEKYVERRDMFREGLEVFIGKKSPLVKNENLSTICDFYEMPNKHNFFLIAIQPKRADYAKNVRAFRGLKSALATKKKLKSYS